MKPTIITGKVTFSGEGKFDGDLYTYGPLEIQTESGLVVLQQVCVHKQVQRALSVGSTVSISVNHTTDKTGRPADMIWGAYDHVQKRTFFNEEMRKISSAMKTGVIVGTLCALIGLLFFIVPGLIIGWQVYKAVGKMGDFPSPEELDQSVESLAGQKTPTIELPAAQARS